jgi:hypothetical protein
MPRPVRDPVCARRRRHGEVYRARDTRLERTVAIKILPVTLAADPQFRERFDRVGRTDSFGSSWPSGGASGGSSIRNVRTACALWIDRLSAIT